MTVPILVAMRNYLTILLGMTLSLQFAPLHSAVPGDFDSSGQVDFVDFLSFAAAFGTSSQSHDLDGDGTVAFGDFLQFVELFAASGAHQPQFSGEYRGSFFGAGNWGLWIIKIDSLGEIDGLLITTAADTVNGSGTVGSGGLGFVSFDYPDGYRIEFTWQFEDDRNVLGTFETDRPGAADQQVGEVSGGETPQAIQMGGSYSGTFSGSEFSGPMTIKVDSSLHVSGRADLPDGSAFTITGVADEYGNLVAMGTNPVHLDTGFVVTVMNGRASGTWLAGGGVSGSIVLQRQ
jgi:hypothetical protein